MPFDVLSARKAGYSDDEITTYLSDFFDVNGAIGAGYTLEELGAEVPARDAPKPPIVELIHRDQPPEEPLIPEAPTAPIAEPAGTTAVPQGEPVETTAQTPEELFTLTAKPEVEPEKERGFVGNVIESFKRGNTQGLLDYMSYEALTGKRDLNEVKKIRKEYSEKVAKDPIEANNWLSKSVMGLSGMLPTMLKGLVEGQAGGAGGALGGGTAGLIGGPATAAAGAGLGYTVGTAAGSAEFFRKIGAGSMYGDLIDKGISEKTASALAHIASVPYALIEQSQVTRAIPGADKALRKIISDNLIKTLGKFATKKGIEIAEESFEEGVQGAIAQTAEEVGKYIEGKSEGLDESAKQIALRFANDFKESIGPMALLMTPKIAKGGVDIGLNIKPKGVELEATPKKVKPVKETKLTPEEEGFVEKVSPEVTIQEPKKVEKPKIEKPKKVEPVVEEKVSEDDFLERAKKRLEKASESLDKASGDALARIDARAKKGQRLGAGLPIDDMIDMSIYGATKIAKGATDFAAFSIEMTRQFGDTIKPHLKELYGRSKSLTKVIVPEEVKPKKAPKEIKIKPITPKILVKPKNIVPIRPVEPVTKKPIDKPPEQDVGNFQVESRKVEEQNEILPETMKDKFIRKIQDKHNRLKNIQEALEPDISDDTNAYLKQDLMTGRAETKLEEFRDKKLKPFTNKLNASKVELKNFEEYAYAKHAPERNAQIKKIRFSTSGEALGIKESEVLNATDSLKEGADELGGKKADLQRKLKVEHLSDTEKKRLNERIGEVDKQLDNINSKIDKMNTQLKDMGVKVEEFKQVTEAGSGMSNEESAEIVSAVEASGKKSQYDSLLKDVNNMNRETADILLEGGLIAKEMHGQWMNYKHYVPLRGINEADVARPRTGKGFDIRGPESKRALGRKSKASNILAHSIMQRNEAVMRAEKNRVGQAFLKFVKQNPNKDLWEIDEVTYKPRFDEKKGEVVLGPDPKFRLADDVMSVKVDGKETHITLKDPALARSMVNLGAEKSNKVLQTFGAFNRYLSIVNTALVPEFVISNFARDIQTMAINISSENSVKLAGKIAKDTPGAIKGIWQAERGKPESEWAKHYKEFQDVGGKIGFLGLKDVDQLQGEIIKEIELMKGGSKAQTVKMYRAVGKFIMNANTAVESGTRLSTYIHMRNQGMSKEKAASVAKNVTVNFNKKGELGTAINSLFVFSNASIQGTARLFKALQTKKGKAIASGIVVGSFALAQLNRQLAGEDDDDVNYYDKIPNWIKENNLIIMKPGTEGKFIKIPVPYGYNVFHAVGQAIDKSVHNPDKEGVLESAAMVAGAVGNSFNPLGSASTLLQTITPTAGRWITDLSLNKNFFGAPIVPEQRFGVKKAKSELAFKSTSESSKKIAKALNKLSGGEKYDPGLVDISPDVMDHVTEFLTGGAGRTINQVVSIGQKLATKKPIPVKEIPFARRVLGEIPEHEDVSRLYKNTDRIRQVRKQYEDFLLVDKQRAREYFAENKALLGYTQKRKSSEGKRLSTVLNKFEKEMKTLRVRKDKLEDAGRNEAAERVNDIILKRTKNFNRIFNQKK